MNWLNIETKTLHDPAYIGSEPRARATWLNVILWCASQENGGVILGAANWKDRQWQQTCGVTKREIEQAAPLLIIEGESVVVWNYPTSKQAEVEARREAGRQGGLTSGASRASSKMEAELQANAQAQRERKEKEKEKEKEKGKEGEGEVEGAGMPAPAAKVQDQTDDEWLSALAASPAYQGIDVAREFAKCAAWCATNRKQPSRRRFINWLNRAERPMRAGSSALEPRFNTF
jgi:hypothetical protein